jgi:hypothetical protein
MAEQRRDNRRDPRHMTEEEVPSSQWITKPEKKAEKPEKKAEKVAA